MYAENQISIKPTMEPLAVSELEAGRLLGVSGRTVFSLRAAGKIRAVKIGDGAKSRVLYPVSELHRFLAGEVAQAGGAL